MVHLIQNRLQDYLMEVKFETSVILEVAIMKIGGRYRCGEGARGVVGTALSVPVEVRGSERRSGYSDARLR